MKNYLVKIIKSKNEKQKGFTLIELIVVLAVLAVVTMVAVPNFAKIQGKAKSDADSRSADIIDKTVTTLLVDGSLTQDGNYLYDGKDVKKLNEGGTAVVDGDSSAVAIKNLLEPTKVQQGTDIDKLFLVKVGNMDTDAPTVDVMVGNYSSDGSTVDTTDYTKIFTP